MATAVQCDECGVMVAELDALSIRSTSMEEGSIGIDLCPTCSEPVRALPAFVREREKMRAAVAEVYARAAATEAEARATFAHVAEAGQAELDRMHAEAEAAREAMAAEAAELGAN